MLYTHKGFALMDGQGRYWTGRKWSAERSEARLFQGGFDAWKDADRAADRRRAAGQACAIVYLDSPLSIHSAGGLPARPRGGRTTTRGSPDRKRRVRRTH